MKTSVALPSVPVTGSGKGIRATGLTPVPKRMALYARVSTKEQTEGKYPSCESQIEELKLFCASNGWEVADEITDPGVSAGSLNRKGLTRMRALVQSGQIDGVVCTWYDRLVRTRDFYILDKEFTSNSVSFLTLHDPTDRATASGRFLETMLVAAKTYEREQTAEKVRIKMQMRKERGLWNGGFIPFGFVLNAETHVLEPDPTKRDLVISIFQTYVDTQSDFKVRDWLKAHRIPSPQKGDEKWISGTIRDMLTNRRYVGEIEINPGNKGMDDLPGISAFRIAKAPHEALVPIELFELAQSIRRQNSAETHNRDRGGKPRGYSQNKCGRVYTLQGRMYCGVCGSSMTPHYTYHKPGPGRKTECYIHYYECSQQIKGAQQIKHKNRVPAKKAENWILSQASDLIQSPAVVEEALRQAQVNCESQLHPQKSSLQLTATALAENQRQMDELIGAVSSGKAQGALFDILNEKAEQLKQERESLRSEQRVLLQSLAPLATDFDPVPLRESLSNFERLSPQAEAVEVQRMIRLTVRRIEWQPDNKHVVEYYHFPKAGKEPKNPPSGGEPDWFATAMAGAGNRTKTEQTFKCLFGFCVLSARSRYSCCRSILI